MEDFMHTEVDFVSLLLRHDSALSIELDARSWPWSRAWPARPQPSRALTQVAVTALLVLTLAGSAAAVGPHQTGRREPPPVLAVTSQTSATPAAPAGPMVEFVWEADGGPDFPLDGPTGMAVDPQGNLWVTDG